MSKNNCDNVFSSVYAGNIDYYAALLKSDHVVLDVHEFYQKQSFRNRCVIAGANGPLNLIVPIQRIGGKSMMKDLKIDHSQNWKKIHWKSLETNAHELTIIETHNKNNVLSHMSIVMQ